MFLIYGMQRSGTTHLCYELDARVSEPMRVLNEPFHIVPSIRKLYGSECDSYTIKGMYDWLISQETIAGIKLVVNDFDDIFADKYHSIFEKVVILRRNLIDIAISLQIAHTNRYWNSGLYNKPENYISSVNVTEKLLDDIKRHYISLNKFIENRKKSGLDMIEIEYDGVTEIDQSIKFLNISKKINPKVYRKITKIRETDDRSERCKNLDRVIEYFKNELGIEYENT